MSNLLESSYDNYRYSNTKLKERIQECVNYIMSKNYGETVLDTDLSKILKFNLDNVEDYKKYKRIMQRIKSFLTNYSYVLKGISHVGYYILKPQQISGYCYRQYVTKTSTLLDKSEKILNHVDNTKFSNDRNEELDNMIALNKDVKDKIWDAITESGYYNRKDYYDSLED